MGNIMRRTTAEITRDAGAIANFVRKKRKDLGYSQETLAMRSGVGLRFLKELELGKKTIKLDKALQVLTFLGGELVVRSKSEGSE